jgi:hypothetical protein
LYIPTDVDADVAPCIETASVRAVSLVEEAGEVLVRVETLEDGGG